jgi:hypothetical protein
VTPALRVYTRTEGLMARRIPKRELDQIVDRDMPGYTVVERATETGAEDRGAAGPASDVVAPGIEELRRKYLGADAAEATDAVEEAADNPGTEDEIIVVEPKESADRHGGASRPKTVIVSGKDRRIVGSQG